jgi:hypothetical protein
MWRRQGSAKDSRAPTDAALHNRLNLLESVLPERRFNRSPRSADDSSRPMERRIEIVNHPKALSAMPARGGQYAGIGKGLGSSFLG